MALSLTDKFLSATYPGVGGTFVFDVDEIIQTIENPGNYQIDRFGVGPVDPLKHGVVLFDPTSLRSATLTDLEQYPIDDINPDISIAANVRSIYDPITRTESFATPLGSKTNPIITDGNPFSVTTASHRDYLELVTPKETGETFENSLQSTFTWAFNEDLALTDVSNSNDEVTPITNDQPLLRKINLYVSTFPEGEGLLPTDDLYFKGQLGRPELIRDDSVNFLGEAHKIEYLTQPFLDVYGRQDYDYNPNRILTATWVPTAPGGQIGTWTWDGGTQENAAFNEFTLPADRSLTAGQKYYWAVRATYIDNEGSDLEQEVVKSRSFVTPRPAPLFSNNAFSSVTVITHGLNVPSVNFFNESVPDFKGGVRDINVPYILNEPPRQVYDLAESIVRGGSDEREEWGLVLEYHQKTGRWSLLEENLLNILFSGFPEITSDDYWQELSSFLGQYVGKPLSLVLDWTDDSIIPDSGFSEAAADAFFASLVQLDQALGGSNQFGNDGNFVSQGKLLSSPLHFIGFSRGTVVNSEIIRNFSKSAGSSLQG